VRYDGTVKLELYDRVSGKPVPVTRATVDVELDDLADPMQSLTVAALEQALEQAKISIRYSGGRE
jgi:hypothetical protein